MFADDTSIFYTNDDLNNLNDTLNSELTSLNSWFKANKLSLNIFKTNVILFNPHPKHVSMDNLKLCINNNPVKQVLHAKYFGIYVDKNLSCKYQMNYIKLILDRNIGVICKILSY